MASYKGLKAILKKFADLIEPVATVKMSAGQNAPLWHLFCFGQLVKIEDYPRLYAELGGASSPWNVGTIPSGYFRLPDFRECSPVGAGLQSSNSNAWDYYKNKTRVFEAPEGNPYTGTGGTQNHDAYLLGTFKDDQLQNITGSLSGIFGGRDFNEYGAFNGVEDWIGNAGSGSYMNVREHQSTFDASRVARTGTTTHGKRVGLYFIIKY